MKILSIKSLKTGHYYSVNMAKKNKQMYHFRFHEDEHSKWKDKAKKAQLTLTAWVERKLNREIELDDHEKHLAP